MMLKQKLIIKMDYKLHLQTIAKYLDKVTAAF